MGNYTNEKGLVVFQENFLTKIKNFFAKAFWRKKADYEEIEYEDDGLNQDYSEKFAEQPESVQKERRLYNFDADNNDDWPGDDKMNNVDDENDKNVNGLNENDDNQEENLEEKYDREIYSEAYIEKQELEQKLMNYYESIKKGI